MSLVTLVIELLSFLDLTIHLLIVPTLQHFQFSWGFHYFYHSHINWKVNCFHRSHRLTFQQLFQHFHFTFLSACTSIQTSNFTNCALHLKWNFQHLHCELLIHLVSRVNFQQHVTVQVFSRIFAFYRSFSGCSRGVTLSSPSGRSASRPCLGSVAAELMILTRSLLFIRLYLISTLLTN